MCIDGLGEMGKGRLGSGTVCGDVEIAARAAERLAGEKRVAEIAEFEIPATP